MGSITILPYQPIKFKNVDEVEASCGCNIQSYCQIVAPTDPTQFQIRSSNDVFNGDFSESADGWQTLVPLIIGLSNFGNETSPGACDGFVTIGVLGGESPYRFSFNGGAFGAPAFNGVQTDLCEGCYYVTVKDSVGLEGSFEYCIATNVDCSEFEGATLQDVIDSGNTLAEFYNCTLNDLKP